MGREAAARHLGWSRWGQTPPFGFGAPQSGEESGQGLRSLRTAAADLFARLQDDEVPFSIPLICFQELLQGARDQKEWRLLDDYLGTQRLLLPDDPTKLHREAARIFFDARRKGITVRSTLDCIIAAQTLRTRGTLLHADEDFEHIPAVRSLKTLRG